MKKYLIMIFMALLLAWSLPVSAQHFALTDTAGSVITSYQVISGNAICTAATTPVSCCTGAGTGTCVGLPASFPTTYTATATGTANPSFASLIGSTAVTYQLEWVAYEGVWPSLPGPPINLSVPAQPPAPTAVFGP